MSIRVMTLVWDRFPGSGSDLLTMLALADWCSDEGDSLHPSIARVAMKIRSSESQARRLLHKLIADGWLEVAGNAFGGAPGTTRQYRMNIRKLMATPVIRATPSTDATPSMDATPRTDATGGTGAQDGSHPCAETGSTGATQSVSRSISKPSEKSSVRSKTARHEYTPDFEIAWRTYPARHTPANKYNAFKAWNARLRAGHTVQAMQMGIDRYHAHVVANGKIGTEFVLMPETFLGVACHFLTAWTVTAPDREKPASAPSSTRSTIERLMQSTNGQGVISHG